MATSEDHNTHWFVMHSLGSQLKMESLLRMRGIECFLPKLTRLRKGLRGTKVEEVPAVDYYIFVHATYDTLRQFKLEGHKLAFIPATGTANHTTLKVPDKQMDDFIRVSTSDQERVRYHRAADLELPRGQRIRICGGSLDGVEGTLLKVKGLRDKRLVLSIPGILSVSTPVDRTYIQLLDKVES